MSAKNMSVLETVLAIAGAVSGLVPGLALASVLRSHALVAMLVPFLSVGLFAWFGQFLGERIQKARRPLDTTDHHLS